MLAWLLNLIIPGAGLIVRRREWLGVVLAMIFGICGNVALAGLLIAPDAIPGWMPAAAGVLCALAWLGAQVLLWRQCRHLCECERGVEALLAETRAALADGDIETARNSLENAVSIDEEHLEVNVLWARLCQHQGKNVEARKWWQRVVELDARRHYRTEATSALTSAEESR